MLAPDFEGMRLLSMDRGHARTGLQRVPAFSARPRDPEGLNIDGTLYSSVISAPIYLPFVWCVCFKCGWCTVDFCRIGLHFRVAAGSTCKYLDQYYSFSTLYHLFTLSGTPLCFISAYLS